MEAELKSLEDKIKSFVALCQRLRADNHELRQQVAATVSENKQLTAKIDDAKLKLETLLEQIPESET